MHLVSVEYEAVAERGEEGQNGMDKIHILSSLLGLNVFMGFLGLWPWIGFLDLLWLWVVLLRRLDHYWGKKENTPFLLNLIMNLIIQETSRLLLAEQLRPCGSTGPVFLRIGLWMKIVTSVSLNMICAEDICRCFFKKNLTLYYNNY